MKPRVLAVAALAALLLAIPTAAQAKGATSATISGGGPGGLPGGPITLKGNGEPGSSTDLGMLAEGAGVFAVLFEDGGGGMAAAPTHRLGPRYTITWTFDDGTGKGRKVRQDVYPYAAGGPVTFMPPGQPVFDSTTAGGWFQGFDGLRAQLIELGLPDRQPLTPATPAAKAPSPAPATPQPAPAATPSSPAPAWPRLIAVAAIFLALAAGTAYTLRRRTAREATAAH
jgi:hypothetical protein